MPTLAFDQEVGNEGKPDPRYVRGRTCFRAGVPEVAHRGVHKVVRYTEYSEDWDGKTYPYWECLKNWPEEFSTDKALSRSYLRGLLLRLIYSEDKYMLKVHESLQRASLLERDQGTRSVVVLGLESDRFEEDKYGGTLDCRCG